MNRTVGKPSSQSVHYLFNHVAILPIFVDGVTAKSQKVGDTALSLCEGQCTEDLHLSQIS